jgi:SAM-dependent methyltransferase
MANKNFTILDLIISLRDMGFAMASITVTIREQSDEAYDVVMAFNILCYIKEDDKVIQRIYELLKPGGVFISATDCLGDKMKLMNVLMSVCSKLRLIPFMKFYKIGDLEENIKRNGFKILETQNLHHGMPNYFIAAMK